MARILALIFCIGLLIGFTGNLSASEVAARVNGIVITTDDIESYIKTYASPQMPLGRQDALKNLIAEALLYAEAKEEKIDEQQNTREKIEREIRRIYANVMIDERVKAKIAVTDQEIEVYYQNNKERFTEPALVNFNMARIAKKDRKGNPVDREVAQCMVEEWKKQLGEPVASVIALCQKNPDLLIEALTPTAVRKGIWEEKVDAAIFTLQSGEVSDVIENDVSYMVIKIVAVSPEKLYELKAVSDSIRKTLEQQKFVALRQSYLDELKGKYKIEIMEKTL